MSQIRTLSLYWNDSEILRSSIIELDVIRSLS